jgi:hypothetical protein
MTVMLEAPPRRRSLPYPVTPFAPGASPSRLAFYGDLTCPWSYLASRRAALLESHGVEVDWWMVEHDRPRPGRLPSVETRLGTARQELERVRRRLLPGERLPEALPEFVPYTRPAVSGYAEAYLAGVGSEARRLLFDAFWLHAVDLGDPRLVRALLVDTVRGGHPSSGVLREWGYAVDVTGAPVTTEAWRLVHRWRTDWSSGEEVVPALVLDDGRRLDGVGAVEWLGAELVRRDIGFNGVGHDRGARETPKRDLADISWSSQHGNRWMQARRDANVPELFSRLRPWL